MSATYTATAARLMQAHVAAGFATPAAAAIGLGLEPSIYRRHEAGKYNARPDELRRSAETFGVSLAWLSSGIGQRPR